MKYLQNLPDWRGKKGQGYDEAAEKGLWKGIL